MLARLCAVLLALTLAANPAFAAKRALFDNAHAETAGNADWVIDSDQPTPLPLQSTVTASTPETYWQGAISSWGIALVNLGYTVATNTTAITYGNASNPQDLANFDVFIVDEPNTSFTPAEATAILSFVRDGGGLIAISDHSGSDRNSDGVDSPMIWNALDPGHLLGAHYGVAGDPNNNISQTSTNVATAALDSVIHNAAGTVTGLAFHNGTTLTLFPGTNPTVRGEVWMTGTAQTSTTGVMAASATYGSGRVFFECDSSPADDGTGAPGNNLFPGWTEAGATDGTLFLNATLWASRSGTTGGGDITPPTASVTSPSGGEAWKVGSVHNITWLANDNVAVTSVDLAYSTDGGATFPNSIATGLANSGSFAWTVPNSPSTTVRVKATAHDAAGNTGSGSSAANFTIDTWTITASAGANGVISPAGAVAVVQGGSRAFTITANGGFQVADVLVDGVSAGAVTSYTFSNVQANHTIAATFAPSAVTFTITASADANGSISPSGSVVVSQGASQLFAISAQPGFVIAAVTVDGVSVGAVASYTFSNVQANHTIVASSTPAFTIAASAGTGGTISPSGTITVANGGAQSFAITANAGFQVASVTVDGASVGAVTSYNFTNVTANHTIAAAFSAVASGNAYPMASGNYLETFGDIANWTNNFAAGIGASYWHSVAVNATGTIPDGIRTTASTAAFTTGTTGGVQKGTGNIQLLSTGTTDNTSADAIDLDLDFTGVTAGKLSYDFATAFNSTGNRNGSLRVYGSPDGVAFTELPAADVLNFTNNVAFSQSITNVVLPPSFSNDANARLRFYFHNGAGGTTGARPKASIDNVVVTGTAAATNWTITASAGANGSISPTGAVVVPAGGSQPFTLNADTGYHVVDVVVDGVSVGAVASYTFTNVTASHTIAASFAINTHTITASAGADGSITPAGAVTVNAGANQSFTITPNAGYHVADVLVDGVSAGAVTTYAFTSVTTNHTIAATFAVTTFTITASADANGSVTPSGAVVVNSGAGATFAIAPNAGYHVADVLVDGISAGAVTSYAFTNVTANHTIAASFAVTTFTITASADANGTITPSGAASVNAGATQSFAITPHAGFHIADVLVDGVSAGPVANYTFTNVTANHTIAANFATTSYTITASTGPNGSITPSGAVLIASGGSQSFTMSPNSGYQVADVLVDGVSAGAVTSYAFTNVTTDHAISASFAPLALGVLDGPLALALARPMPNPSPGATLLVFSVPKAAHTRIEILDASGRRVALHEGDLAAGRYQWKWDGVDLRGAPAGSGVYFVHLSTPLGSRQQRIALLR